MRLRLSVLAAALLTAIVPAGGVAADPVRVPGPGVCNGRLITIDETEKLEERTLYFHGASRVGNVDGNQDLLQGTQLLTMNATPPASSDDKVYVTRPTGVAGNPNFARNPHHGYWLYSAPVEERMVCAGATVHAATTAGSLIGQLWIDQPSGTTAVRTAQTSASAPANQVSSFAFNFGALDVPVTSDIVFQLDSPPPGALTYYDSVGRPSAFTYVVVVPA